MQFPTDQFITFAKQYRVPDYVKAASTKNFEDIDDPHTKVGCYLARFASLTGQKIHISDKETVKRAAILNILDDIRDLDHNYSAFQQKSTVKTAAQTEKYPIRNKSEFLASQKWLKKNAYAMPIPERRELAKRLIKAASQYEEPVDDQLTKFAGQGTGDVRRLIPNLLKRAELIRASRLNTKERRNKTAENLEVLAEIAKLQPNQTTTPDNLDKIAATLQFLDNEYGLHAHYHDRYIDPPDDASYVHSVKTAQEVKTYACELGEEIYDIRDFEKIKIADILDTFGEDFVTAMADTLTLNHEKVAAVLNVMTDVEKSLFYDLVKSAGIQPQYFQRKRVNLQELAKILA